MILIMTSLSSEVDLERYEAKYLIHPSLVPEVRRFIEPFCHPDAHAAGAIPEYVVTTLQLDSPDLALYRAKEEEALNRFKLRVRTYGLDGKCPVFLEVKRKIKGVIAKSRVALPFAEWRADLCLNPPSRLVFQSPRQSAAYWEFVRLTRELDARPKVLLRYHRESYLGTNDRYARVTFDRLLCYRVARTWDLLPADGRWWSLDSALALRNPYSGVILELKTFGDAPVWMVDMTERFNLVRIGFSKYFNAMRSELLFGGLEYSAAGEACGRE